MATYPLAPAQAEPRALEQSEPSCSHCGLPVPGRRAGGPSGSSPLYCCFGCRLASELARPAANGDDAGGVSGTHLLRLGLGVFLGMNIMVFSWLGYASELFGTAVDPREAALHGLFSWTLLLLSSIVMATLGGPLLLDALSVRRGAMDANLLIGLGVGAAFVLSAIHTVSGKGRLYYDTATMTLVLVTLGGALESAAKRRAFRSAQSLLASVPQQAWVERGTEVLAIDATELAPGDRIRVRPGEAIAADALVLEGLSHVDEASLTGESRPRAVGPGDAVFAGSISIDGQLRLRATRVGAERVIARTEALLAVARTRKPRVERAADLIAARFVPGVVVLALAVAGWHAVAGDPTRGLFDALAVLLISCPCALGLAAPLATHSALNRAARLGVLIDSAATLERAARIDRVLFDKTGTLTRPNLELNTVESRSGIGDDRALLWAAALESASLHPIANALVRAAAARGLVLPVVANAVALPGLGVAGVVEGRPLWLGSARLLAQRSLSVSGEPAAGRTCVYLMDDTRVLGRFTISEQLRTDAATAVSSLRAMAIEPALLTGDEAGATAAIAGPLGLRFDAGLLPAEKLSQLETMRAGRSRPAIAFVGDGINDAPVLGAADVGFVMAGGADLARVAGNVLLLSDRLERVPQTLALARHALRSIHLSLGWAFAYNLIGLGLAVCGRLTPVVSAAAMVASSLFVVFLSSRAGQPVERAAVVGGP